MRGVGACVDGRELLRQRLGQDDLVLDPEDDLVPVLEHAEVRFEGGAAHLLHVVHPATFHQHCWWPADARGVLAPPVAYWHLGDHTVYHHRCPLVVVADAGVQLEALLHVDHVNVARRSLEAPTADGVVDALGFGHRHVTHHQCCLGHAVYAGCNSEDARGQHQHYQHSSGCVLENTKNLGAQVEVHGDLLLFPFGSTDRYRG